MSEKKLVTRHRIFSDNCKVELGGETRRLETSGYWIDERPDDPKVRKDVLSLIASKFGLLKRLPVSSIERIDVLPQYLAVESSLKLERPLPVARAKVILQLKYDSKEELDQCYAFEDKLEALFEGSEIGFVDGNEVGQGEFDIFIFDPRRQPILELLYNHLEFEVSRSRKSPPKPS